MTPGPSLNVIVQVSLPGIAVSLGYATVGGFWHEESAPVRPWRTARETRTAWGTRPAPGTVWEESD